jgi:hypothetical protein
MPHRRAGLGEAKGRNAFMVVPRASIDGAA